MCWFGHFKCSVSVRAWVNICSASHFSPHPPTNWQPLSSSSSTRQTSNIRDLQKTRSLARKNPVSCQRVCRCHCHCIDWSSNTRQKMNHTKKWRTKQRNGLWTTRFWDCIRILFGFCGNYLLMISHQIVLWYPTPVGRIPFKVDKKDLCIYLWIYAGWG